MASIDRILRSNIKLRHLQLIAALDEFRHLGKTAEFLAVSQPAVSKMLGDVELMLGVVLFERSTRGTEPTVAGKTMIRFARSVLAQYESTREEISAVESGVLGRVRVGAMGNVIPVLLPQAIAALKQTSRRASVLVEEGDLAHLLPKLRLMELDMVIGRMEPGYAAPDLLTEPLYEEPMVLVVAPGHALTRKAVLQWRDLLEWPCVLPPPWASLRVKIEQEFYRHGLKLPRDTIETSSYLMLRACLARLQSYGFVAESVGRRWEGRGECALLPLAGSWDLPAIGVMTLRSHGLSRGSQMLLNVLRQAAQSMPS